MAVRTGLALRFLGCAVALASGAGLHASSAQSILDALRNGTVLRAQHTDCHRAPIRNPVTLTTLLHFRGGVLVKEGLGSPGHYDPWQISIPTAGISGGSITNGPDTFRLSADGLTCSYELRCPEARNGRVLSCSVEGGGAAPRTNTPTVTTADPAVRGPSVKGANPAVRGGPSVKAGNPAVGGPTVNVTEPSVLQPTRP